jgi:diaminopimelate epimerase
MQGAGNDFVAVEAGSIVKNWPQLAIAMCDRHFGVGADGLLLVSPSSVADVGMRIFNADGSEANICGNGVRCVVTYHVEKNRLRAAEGTVTVETRSGVRDAWFSQTAGKVVRVRVGMGVPRFGLTGDPDLSGRHQVDITLMNRCGALTKGTRLEFDLVSLGNSHAVVFTEMPVSDFPLPELAVQMDRCLHVSGGVNFEVARIVNRGRIEARVLENGVGETLACGSGACAIGVAAHERGYTDNEVQVSLPGGALAVECSMPEVFLTGPAETVFHGDWLGVEDGAVRTAPSPIKNEVVA